MSELEDIGALKADMASVKARLEALEKLGLETRDMVSRLHGGWWVLTIIGSIIVAAAGIIHAWFKP